jgi:hypothetical protein
MPTADKILAYRCTKTVCIPSCLAIAHACCPPAPPKQASTCWLASKPRACVNARMGLHIASFATSMKPRATSETDFWGFPVAAASWFTCAAICARARLEPASSHGTAGRPSSPDREKARAHGCLRVHVLRLQPKNLCAKSVSSCPQSEHSVHKAFQWPCILNMFRVTPVLVVQFRVTPVHMLLSTLRAHLAP